MTPSQKQRVESLIAKQLTMSQSTLEAMRHSGLRQDQEVQLDFSFYAPNEKAARSLEAYLKQNDCLSVSVKRDGRLLSRKYVVEGKTHPTLVNTEVLSQWLPWIIVQGITCDCEFDGFGAEI